MRNGAGVRQTRIPNLFRIDKFVHKALLSACLAPSLRGRREVRPARSASGTQSARSCSCWRSVAVFSGRRNTPSAALLPRWAYLMSSSSSGTKTAPGSRLPLARARPYATGQRGSSTASRRSSCSGFLLDESRGLP